MVCGCIPVQISSPSHLFLQHWLDPSKRVARQIRTTSPVTLYLGVKFYAADPCRLIEEITRYHFFLQVRVCIVRLEPTASTSFYNYNSFTQVKLDVLQGRLPISQDLAVELAALSLQGK